MDYRYETIQGGIDEVKDYLANHIENNQNCEEVLSMLKEYEKWVNYWEEAVDAELARQLAKPEESENTDCFTDTQDSGVICDCYGQKEQLEDLKLGLGAQIAAFEKLIFELENTNFVDEVIKNEAENTNFVDAVIEAENTNTVE